MNKAARRELRDFLAANGLSVTTLTLPSIDVNIAAAMGEMRNLSLATLRQTIELAGDLGAEGVVIGPGKANPLFPMSFDELLNYFYEALDHLLPLAEIACTSLFVQNMPSAFLPAEHDLRNALNAYGDASVGIAYDVANGHFIGEDIGEALRACAPRLRTIHLSDTAHDVHRHAAVGLGSVDFHVLPDVLAQIEYMRRPMLEIVADDPDDAIERSARKLHAIGIHHPRPKDVTWMVQ